MAEYVAKQNRMETSDVIDEVAGKVRETAAQASSRAQEITSSAAFGIRTLAKAYPFATIAGAFAGGLLIGLLGGRVFK